MKKLLALSTLILSTSIYAEANTSAKLVHNFDHLRTNQDIIFSSDHIFTISNNTSEVQHISVCYDLIACSNDPNYIKNTRRCQSFDLPAWQTKSEHDYIVLNVNYPFRGWCEIYAKTETTGGTYSVSYDRSKFELRND